MTAEIFTTNRKIIGSQFKVANLLGVCQAQISIWEKGYKPVPENVAIKIKDLIKIKD